MNFTQGTQSIRRPFEVEGFASIATQSRVRPLLPRMVPLLTSNTSKITNTPNPDQILIYGNQNFPNSTFLLKFRWITFYIRSMNHTWGNLRSMGYLASSFYPYWFHKFFLGFSVNVTKSAFVKEKNSKMRHLKKFMKTMEVNRICIGFTNFLILSHL